MTDLQVKYQSLQEEKRHNAAMEEMTRSKYAAEEREKIASAVEKEKNTQYLDSPGMFGMNRRAYSDINKNIESSSKLLSSLTKGAKDSMDSLKTVTDAVASIGTLFLL